MRNLYRLLRHDWPAHFVLRATDWLPDNVVFHRLRGALARPFLGRCGKNLRLGRNITFSNPINIEVGDDVYAATGCWFFAGETIRVGDEVLFGPYAVVSSGNHGRKDRSFRYGPPERSPIEIKRGAWVGAHATVTAGCTIGCGSVVGAGAVATGTIDDDSLAAGVPARVLRKIEDAAEP